MLNTVLDYIYQILYNLPEIVPSLSIPSYQSAILAEILIALLLVWFVVGLLRRI